MTSADLASVLAAIDDSMAAVEKLDRLCCEPGRSPSMAALASSLAATRRAVASDPAEDDTPAIVAGLEDAGGLVGRLQVGCCAPARLPLYTRILANLTTAQRAISGSHDH